MKEDMQTSDQMRDQMRAIAEGAEIFLATKADRAQRHTPALNPEYTWGKDWLVVIHHDDAGKMNGLDLYISEEGNNTSTPEVSVTGTADEMDRLYEWLLFGTGTSINPAPGSLTYTNTEA